MSLSLRAPETNQAASVQPAKMISQTQIQAAMIQGRTQARGQAGQVQTAKKTWTQPKS